MKYCIVLVTLFLLSTYSNEITVTDHSLDMTVEEFESYLMGFLTGLHVEKYTNATLPCKTSVDIFLEEAFDTYEDFKEKKYYDAILGVADVLGESSPLARNCSVSAIEIIKGIQGYINSFDGFLSWINQVEKNVWSNFVGISIITSQLVAELQKVNANYTYVSEWVGEIVYYSIDANQTENALTYTKTDPLEPSPLNEKAWITLESIYEFLTASKLVLEDPMSKCEGAVVNMLLYQTDSYNNIVAQNTEEGIFLALDSFVFLHDLVEQCTESGLQIYTNGTVAYENISTNPEKILDNFKSNLFQVVSGSAATYAQIYHKDIISLFKVLGGVVYNTLVATKE